MPTDTIEDRYVLERECHAITGLSRSTRWRLIRAGKFPKKRHISPGRVGWLLSALRQWQKDCKEAAA